MKQGWEFKKLGEICRIVNGGTPDTKVANYWDGEHLWITPKDMGGLQSKYVDNTSRKITSVGLKNSSAKLLPVNSVLLSSRAPIGYLAINTREISTNQGCKGLVPKKGLDAHYLYYFLLGSVELLNELGSGTTFKELSGSKLSEICVPFPSIIEQKRIVSTVDKFFAFITKTKSNAEQNLKNTKELFESYLQGVFENKGEDWEEKTLTEVCEIKPGKKEARDKLKETDFVTFLPMEDLGILNKEIHGVKERQLKDVADSYTYFAENDILLAKITPCFENGKIGIARNLINGVGFGSSEYIVFRTQGNIEPEFLYYFLSRNQIRDEGIKYMSGAVGHKRISKYWIENYLVPFPKSLKAQQTIVQKLDVLSAETKKIEAIYQKKINNLEELKKSILQKAFSGELTKAEVVV